MTGIFAPSFDPPLLAIYASSANTALVPDPTVNYTSPNSTGTLTYHPIVDQSGTATITVTARCGGANGYLGGGDDGWLSRTFTVNVNPVNDAPTLDPIANPATISEDASQQGVNLSGITAGGGESQALQITANSSNIALIPNPIVTYASPNGTASLAYTPVANRYGSALITVTARDAGLDGTLGNGDDATFSRTFTVNVNPVNDAPTLDPIANPATINEDASQQVVNLSGITAGGGESQALQITANSSNTALIPNPTVTYASPNGTGSLAYTPVANQYGSALITVTARDAGLDGTLGNGDDATFSRTFTVNVNPVNDAPTLDNSGEMSLATINQNAFTNSGTTIAAMIASAGGDRITDIDTGAVEGIAAIGADNSHGTWQYSTDGGSNWFDLGSPTAMTARLLAADANTRVRFVPAADWYGVVSAGLTFKAWDRATGVNGSSADTSTSGGTTAFSNSSETAAVLVNALPVLTTISPLLSAQEDTAFPIAYQTLANAADEVDPDGSTVSFRVESVISGTLTKNGSTVIPGDTTLGPGEQWVWTPECNTNGTLAAFSVRVWDGVGVSGTPLAVGITVAAHNDPPARTAGTVSRLTVLENSAAANLGLAGVTYSTGGGGDEAAQSLAYTIIQVPPSNVGEVLLADGVTVVGTGAYSLADLRGMQFRPTANSSGSATFLFRVQDNGGTASGGYDVLTEAMTISVTSLADTVGLFYADASIFTLKTTGTSNQDDGFQVQFYSNPQATNWLPLTGDWDNDADHITTIGLYDSQSSSFFSLRNDEWNCTPQVMFGYGMPNSGWLPIAGDWNGDGIDSVGLYDPVSSHFWLRSTNTDQYTTTEVAFGVQNAGYLPVAGDWNGDGLDTVGVYDPSSGWFMLSNSTSSPAADIYVHFDDYAAGWKPIAGDWDGSGTDTVGLYQPATSTTSPVFHLKNANSTSAQDLEFVYGAVAATYLLVAGHWNTPPTISQIANQTSLEDEWLVINNVSIADPQSDASHISVTASCANPSLFQMDAEHFAWDAPLNQLRLKPAQLQFGTDVVTIKVDDGQQGCAYTTFRWDVQPVEHDPTIQFTSPRATIVNRPLTVSIAVNDIDSGPNTLAVTASVAAGSPNPELVASCSLAGAGSSRYLTITPASNAVGTAIIAVTVQDGDRSVTEHLTFTVGYESSTLGLYSPNSSHFWLNDSLASGTDAGIAFGAAGASWTPLTGDWNGDGKSTVGLYDTTTSAWFYLTNDNSSGAAQFTFGYGAPGWQPIGGDWDGNGTDTVGLYDPASSTFYLRNSNTSGAADYVLGFGVAHRDGHPDWIPVAGDWDGDGTDTVGLYDPELSQFYLCGSNVSPAAAYVTSFGCAGSRPVVGDWNADGIDSIGLYMPSTAIFLLTNSNQGQYASYELPYGVPGSVDIPIAGDWDGIGISPPNAITLSPRNDVVENSSGQVYVGTLSTVDPEGNGPLTYALVEGPGGANSGSFTLRNGNQLYTSGPLDHEAFGAHYSVRVRSTDSTQLSLESSFQVQVTNVNDAPTLTSISDLQGGQEDQAYTISYQALAAAADEADQDGDTLSFWIDSVTAGALTKGGIAVSAGSTLLGPGEQLLWTPPAHVYGVTQAFRVRGWDGHLLSTTSVPVNVSLQDAPRAPTGLHLSCTSVEEQLSADATVGIFSTEDPSPTDTFTYSLVAGAGDTDNGSFHIAGNELRTSTTFNFDVRSSYRVRVRTTDQTGLFLDKVFTITVNDTQQSLGAPNQLTAMVIASSPNQVCLNWKDNSTDELGFEIEHRASASQPWQLYSTVNIANASRYQAADNSFLDLLQFRVRAYNQSGPGGSRVYSGYSDLSTEWLWSAPVTYLSVRPVPAAALPTTSGGISLSWNAAPWNDAMYDVVRSTDGRSYTVVENGANITATGFMDTTVQAGVSYSYIVYSGIGIFDWVGGTGGLRGQPATTGFVPAITWDGADQDGDGLSNAGEWIRGTNPLSGDSDGDTLPDGWEVQQQPAFDPLNSDEDSNGVFDGSDDFDGDGRSNHEECVAGRDVWTPDAGQAPATFEIDDRVGGRNQSLAPIHLTLADPDSEVDDLTVTAHSSNQALIPDDNIFISGTGADRTIRVSPALDQTGWADIEVTAVDPEGDATSNTFRATVDDSSSGHYYRVVDNYAGAYTGAGYANDYGWTTVPTWEWSPNYSSPSAICRFELFATWDPSAPDPDPDVLASQVTYLIVGPCEAGALEGTAGSAEVPVNQAGEPAGMTFGGRPWQSLGVYRHLGEVCVGVKPPDQTDPPFCAAMIDAVFADYYWADIGLNVDVDPREDGYYPMAPGDLMKVDLTTDLPPAIFGAPSDWQVSLTASMNFDVVDGNGTSLLDENGKVEWSLAKKPESVYVKALDEGNYAVTMDVWNPTTGEGTSPPGEDDRTSLCFAVTGPPPTIDVDVDSDNNDPAGVPARFGAEGQLEDNIEANPPGKYIAVAPAGDNQQRYVPMVVEVQSVASLPPSATVTFVSSDTSLRLWRTNGSTAQADSLQFGTEYSLSSLGIEPGVPKTFYVEAVDSGFPSVETQLRSGIHQATDTVAFTAIDENITCSSCCEGFGPDANGYLRATETDVEGGGSRFSTSAQAGGVGPGESLRLIFAGNAMAVVDGDQVEIYDSTSTGFQPRESADVQGTLAWGENSTLVESQPSGEQLIFGASGSTLGRLLQIIPADAGQVVREYEDGLLTSEITSAGRGASQEVTYEYEDGKVSRMTTKSVTAMETTQRVVAYSYTHEGDLELVTVHEASASGPVLEQKYYRYYEEGETGGYPHGLKYVLGADAVRRMSAAGVDYLSPGTTDAGVAPYADEYFEYDSQRRVTTRVTSGAGCSLCGGQGAVTYTYSASGNTRSDANWANKRVETSADGSTLTEYFNYRGQVLVSDSGKGGQHWITYHQYDADGNVTLTAQPSAVMGYSEAAANLAVTLRADQGLIEVSEYYASTTAPEYPASGSPTAGGGVKGYLRRSGVKQGTAGSTAWQAATDYVKKTVGGRTAFFPYSNTQYPDATSTAGAVTTTYHYTFYDVGGGVTGPLVKTQETVLPAVAAEHNGSGQSTSTFEVFDGFGRVVWARDAAGHLDYTQYDAVTGAVVKQIADANTSLLTVGDKSLLPSAWETTSGVNLVTSMEVDYLGRTTKLVDPAGNVTYTVYNDANHEVRTYPGWNSATHQTTGPIEVSRDDLSGTYSEVFTYLWTGTLPLDAQGRPTGTEAISNSSAVIQSLSRSMRNDVGQVTRHRDYFSLAGVSYSTSVNLGVPGTNYLETASTYDPLGRLAVTQDPTGTREHTFYDAQGRVSQVWVGTDDLIGADTNSDGAVDLRDFRFWVSQNPSANTGPTGTLMYRVSANTYDAGGIGDGNLTESRSYFDDGPSDYYATAYQYDWRDRLTDTRVPGGIVSHTDYDNLGQTLATTTYASSDFILGSSERRAKTESLYDELGRAYESRTYEVDPASGATGSALVTETWYDPRGLVAKTATPSGLFTKFAYDGAGQLVVSCTGYDAAEQAMTDSPAKYDAAMNLSGDTVIEQSQTWYKGGLAVAQATFQRFAGDTTTSGALDAANSYASASATWYDRAGRAASTADYGREDTGSGLTHYFFSGSTGAILDSNNNQVPDVAEASAPAPNASDNDLATQTVYEAAINTTGPVTRTVDNAGHSTLRQYDLLGRTLYTIENYVNYTDYLTNLPAETDTAQDVTTKYQYDSAGRLATMTAYNAKGSGGGVEAQATKYLYGSPVNASWQTAVVAPDSTDALSPTAGGWSLISGTDHTATAYDRLGRTTSTTDPRGVVHQFTYDAAGRPTADTVTSLGASGLVDGTVRRLGTAYDDLGRVEYVTSYSDTAGASVLNQVRTDYNGWGQVFREYQEHNGAVDSSTLYVQYNYGTAAQGARLTSVRYPNGRLVHYTYGAAGSAADVLNRLDAIKDDNGAGQPGATLASYKYLGADTIVEENYAQPQVKLDYAASNYGGFDRFGRVVDQVWKDFGGTAVDEYRYTYDRASNRTSRENVVAGSQYQHLDELYAYDPLGQLTAAHRGDLNTARDAIVAGTENFYQSWGLDALGNWSACNNNGTAQTRTHDAANELTAASGWATPAYDLAGNMTSIPKPSNPATAFTLTYDAWNRLSEVRDGATLVAKYTYDATGRRTVKQSGAGFEHFFLSGQQVIETRDAASSSTQPESLNPTYQFVWSPRYIDSPILRDTYSTGTLQQASRLYYLNDANFNITALVNTSGTVVERYTYTPYGNATVLDANFAADADNVSDFASTTLSAGRELDPESGLYYNRARYYSAELGRFVGRDPAEADVNYYRYVGNSPTRCTDPSGLFDYSFNSELLHTGDRKPTSTDNGGRETFSFRWVNSLDPLLAVQQVTTRAFLVVETPKHTYQAWADESFVEAWSAPIVLPGHVIDTHLVSPRVLANPLAGLLGTFREIASAGLRMGREEVCSWFYHQVTTFEIYGGNYPEQKFARGKYYKSGNQISGAYILEDNLEVGEQTLQKLLYPSKGPVRELGFPPPQRQGAGGIRTEEWQWSWRKGQQIARGRLSADPPDGYKPIG